MKRFFLTLLLLVVLGTTFYPTSTLAATLDIITGGGIGAIQNQQFSVEFTTLYTGTYPLTAVFTNVPPGLSASNTSSGGTGTTTLNGLVAQSGSVKVYLTGIPNQRGTWITRLTVSDGYGLSDSTEMTIGVGEYPITNLTCDVLDSKANVLTSAPVNTPILFLRGGGDITKLSEWTVVDTDGVVVNMDNSGFLGGVVVKYSTLGNKTINLKSGNLFTQCGINIVPTSSPTPVSILTCTIDKPTVQVGESVVVTGNWMGSPYTFDTDGGQIVAGGSSANWAKVVFNSPGSKVITLHTSGSSAQCFTTVISSGIIGSDVVPFIRLYNAATNDHFYTTSRDEAGAAEKHGYRIEGEMGHLLKDWVNGAHSLHRLYSSITKKHFYTTNGAEAQAAQSHGYTYEGVVGYFAADLKGELGTPVYRMYHPRQAKHFYTSQLNEYNALIDKGFIGEGPLDGWLILSFK